MFFKGVIHYFIVFVLYFPVSALATETSSHLVNSLQAMPKKCVALHKGRECFSTINIQWNAAFVGDYCLVRFNDKKMIHCWSSVKSGNFKYAFSSAVAEKIELIKLPQQELLSTVLIEVGWVYQSKKRRGRWRMF